MLLLLKRILFGMASLVLFGACNKLVDAPAPSSVIEYSTVYANDANAELAMQGVYLQIMDNARGPYNGNETIYSALSADELELALPPTALTRTEDSFYLNQINPGNLLNANFYTGSYRIIYFLNSMLDGLSGPNGLSAAKDTALTGEVKMLRAFIYFYLVNFYGEVPLVTTTLYTTTSTQARAPVSVVYQQILKDLQDAQKALPAVYITNDRTRPKQAVALALMARVWLFLGNWSQAALAASQVIGDARYQLEADLTTVFLNGSREAIWQLRPVYSQQLPTLETVAMATAEGAAFLPKNDSTAPAYMLSDSLLNSWEPGDQRVMTWTKKVVVRGKAFVYPWKYKQALWLAVDPEYEMVLRLAELYLIRAEARARMGDGMGAAADLNLVRLRAGLGVTTATTGAELVETVLKERRVELMVEWGHRWLDLKRMGMVNKLYPIPTSEILANPRLTQNPGYPQ